jgi:hypothetical protein
MRNLSYADCKSTETFGCMSRGDRVEVVAKSDEIGKDGIGGISTLQTCSSV